MRGAVGIRKGGKGAVHLPRILVLIMCYLAGGVKRRFLAVAANPNQTRPCPPADAPRGAAAGGRLRAEGTGLAALHKRRRLAQQQPGGMISCGSGGSGDHFAPGPGGAPSGRGASPSSSSAGCDISAAGCWERGDESAEALEWQI